MLRRSMDSDGESSSEMGMPTQVDTDSEDGRPLVRVSRVPRDVVEALEQDLSEAHPSSQSPVRNRFAILDPIEGNIRSEVIGSTEDGDVEGFPLTDEDGKGQVGQRRVVLVPAESQGTPQSIQDREPPSTMPVTTIPASSGTVRRLVLVQSQQRDEAVSTVLGTPVGLALADGGFDVGSTPEDSQQVSAHVEVLPGHASRRVVLARMEGVAAEESQHMLHDGPQTVPTQGDSPNAGRQ